MKRRIQFDGSGVRKTVLQLAGFVKAQTAPLRRVRERGIFHLTHRCHNRTFLLKFARDRDAYRAKLREHLHQFHMVLLDYCLTSNHVHVLVDAEERLEVWTESLATGCNSFVEKIQPLIFELSFILSRSQSA